MTTTINISAGVTSSGLTVSSGTNLVVLSGGTISSTTVSSGGTVYISKGGTDSATTLAGGTLNVYGSDVSATVTSGGLESVYSGGIATGANVRSSSFLFVQNGGSAVGTTDSGGVYRVYSGGHSISTTLINASEIVSAGGTESAATISPGGTLNVYGSAVSATDFNYVEVYSGGFTSDTIVSSGGSEIVLASGSTTSTTVCSGGVEIISSGGSATNITLSSGGTISVYALAYSSGASATLNSSSDVLTISAGGSSTTLQLAGNYTGEYFHVTSASGGGIAITQDNVPCFCAGTRIATMRGEVDVADLVPGDMLVTRFGPLRPVKWIGRKNFNGLFLGKEKAPVCFRAGSIAADVPCRDLYVSPGHSMVIDNRLVEAKLLVNGVTITQDVTTGQVDYFHVDLGVHDCVVADGAWSESYAEQDNRASFHNAAEFAALFPDHQATYQEWCLPQIHSAGPDLVPILAKLADRYPAGGFTDDPDLHLMADGTRIDPSLADGLSWHFEVPAGVRGLRLVSRACSPVTAGLSGDCRRLGFRIMGITVSAPAETRVFQVSHRQFGPGVHELEEQDGQCWRWTDGDCQLPDALLAGIDEPVTLVLSGRPFAKFLVVAPVQEGAAVASAPALIEANCGSSLAETNVACHV